MPFVVIQTKMSFHTVDVTCRIHDKLMEPSPLRPSKEIRAYSKVIYGLRRWISSLSFVNIVLNT